MKTTIYAIIGIVSLIYILFSNVMRSSSSKNVNRLIQDAKKSEANKSNLQAINILKKALAAVLGVDEYNRWSLYEVKDNFNMNGWYIINELKRLYAIENIPFDIKVWAGINGKLGAIERHDRNQPLKDIIQEAFKNLP